MTTQTVNFYLIFDITPVKYEVTTKAQAVVIQSLGDRVKFLEKLLISVLYHEGFYKDVLKRRELDSDVVGI